MSPYRIAYVGPAGSGRTTSLANVLKSCGVAMEPLSLDASIEHHATLIRGHERIPLVFRISSVRSNLYYQAPDAPEVHDAVAPELDWLCSADGIVFVLDSQVARAPGNEDELKKLRRDLLSRGIDLDNRLLVFQANKRDLPNISSMATLGSRFGTPHSVIAESTANKGTGTTEVVLALIELIQTADAVRPRLV